MAYGDPSTDFQQGSGSLNPLQLQILAGQQAQASGGTAPYGLTNPLSYSGSLGPVNSVGASQGLNQQILQGQAQNLGYQGLLAQLANQLQMGNLLGNYGLQNTLASSAAPNTIAKGLAGSVFPGLGSMLAGLPSAISGLTSGLGGLGNLLGLPGGMSSNGGAGFNFSSPGASPTAAQQIAAGGQASGAGMGSGGAGGMGGGGLQLAGNMTADQMGFSPTEAAMVPGGALYAPANWQGPTQAQRFGYLGTASPSIAMGSPQMATGGSNLSNLLSNMGLS